MPNDSPNASLLLEGRGTTVYRLFDVDDDLLYVGIAGNPGRRFEQHAKDKPWWSEVDHIGLEHHPDRRSALAAERLAIVDEKPRYNVVHNSHRAPAGTLDLVWLCHECDQPIANGMGYLESRWNDVAAARDGRRDSRARARARARENIPHFTEDELDGLELYNGADLFAIPDRAPWLAWHVDCDPEPDAGSYWIGVERIRTWPQVLSWTAHLMEKDWLEDTDWSDLLHSIARQSGASARAAS